MLQCNEKIIKHKVGLLNVAKELGNVSKACQIMGLSRDTFYRYRDAVEDGGVEALNQALSKYGKPEIFYPDQGSQFTSFDFTDGLTETEITISMDRRGRCTDNIFIFSTEYGMTPAATTNAGTACRRLLRRHQNANVSPTAWTLFLRSAARLLAENIAPVVAIGIGHQLLVLAAAVSHGRVRHRTFSLLAGSCAG